MENILTFDQFVNEKYGKDSLFVQDNTDLDGFKPYVHVNTDDQSGEPVTSIDDLLVGKEYAIKLNSELHKDLFYQGYSADAHMFSSEKLDFRFKFTASELIDLIDSNNISTIKE